MCERLTNTECSKSTIRRIPMIENDINQFEIDRYIFIHLLYYLEKSMITYVTNLPYPLQNYPTTNQLDTMTNLNRV